MIRKIYIKTGQFIIGGPDGDTNLTGRKIIVDTYGGAACMVVEHSQKDPQKLTGQRLMHQISCKKYLLQLVYQKNA